MTPNKIFFGTLTSVLFWCVAPSDRYTRCVWRFTCVKREDGDTFVSIFSILVLSMIPLSAISLVWTGPYSNSLNLFLSSSPSSSTTTEKHTQIDFLLGRAIVRRRHKSRFIFIHSQRRQRQELSWLVVYIYIVGRTHYTSRWATGDLHLKQAISFRCRFEWTAAIVSRYLREHSRTFN